MRSLNSCRNGITPADCMLFAVMLIRRSGICAVPVAPGDSTIEEPRFSRGFDGIICLPETKEESCKRDRTMFCAVAEDYSDHREVSSRDAYRFGEGHLRQHRCGRPLSLAGRPKQSRDARMD